MTNKKQGLAAFALAVFMALALSLTISGCKKKFAAPKEIQDVRMEAGVKNDEFIFYARFLNEKGKQIMTQGTLEIELSQEGKVFFSTAMKVEADHFVPFGHISRYQFRSDPFSIASFRFEPRINQMGWYDHTLKAKFLFTPESPPLTFTGGHIFKENPKP